MIKLLTPEQTGFNPKIRKSIPVTYIDIFYLAPLSKAVGYKALGIFTAEQMKSIIDQTYGNASAPYMIRYHHVSFETHTFDLTTFISEGKRTP